MRRSPHNLSYNHKFTCKMGQLIPCLAQMVNAGDTLLHSVGALLRCLPLATPVMHLCDVEVITTYTPIRLLWDDFENFITGGPDGMDATQHPRIALNHTIGGVGTLSDYLGYKNDAATWTAEVNALFHRCYAFNFNELFRDQDLVTPLPLSKASGLDTTTNYTLQNAAWGRDNFTTARPWTQKGPEVTLPLGTTAPLVLKPSPTQSLSKQVGGGGAALGIETDGSGGMQSTLGQPSYLDVTGAHQVDLTGASAVDVNQVRLAFALQRYEEARARWGSRYTEYLRYLGIRASDARLQRPEVLSRGRNTISFTEVLNTADSTGEMFGHGIAGARGNKYMYFAEEHGVLMTFLVVRPRTQYMQGTARRWFYQTKEDYIQQELQHIGQQEVFFKEVRTSHATPDATFGYQDRYYDWKHNESEVSGLMRTTLKDWHMAREFDPGDNTVPQLNSSFVTSNPTSRVFQDTAGDQLLLNMTHNLRARRLLDASGKSYIL